MSQRTALLIEASGIQHYIFSSNELVQHIGASELVMQATSDWLFDENSGLLPRPNNVLRARFGATRWGFTDKGLDDGLPAEVVYTGGGNALILFANDTDAKELTYRLTRKALESAPGLRLAIARRSYEPGKLREAANDLHDDLARQKRAPEPGASLLGLGVTAACDFTGRPAVAIDAEKRYISAEVKAKRAFGRSDGPGAARLTDYLEDIARHGYRFIANFDDLGVRDESSYLAVVHTDGNRMGERIPAYVDAYEKKNPGDRGFIEAQREFSRAVQEATYSAVVSTAGLLIAPGNHSRVTDSNGRQRYKIGGEVPIPEIDGRQYLPFRPIVFGGDDVTFVCEGRLGLPLAAHYLAHLADTILPDGEPLYARAGVAIVKTHYPFARAYQLAEALCKSAREFIGEIDPKYRRVTALDWHFAATGLIQPLAKLRRREYRLGPGEDAPTLLMRPVQVTQDPGIWRSWDTFCDITKEFTREKGPWVGRRNKLKGLREALREGADSVTVFLRSFPRVEGEPWPPKLPNPRSLKSQVKAPYTGWAGDRCVYFDAIEALDFNIPLKEV